MSGWRWGRRPGPGAPIGPGGLGGRGRPSRPGGPPRVQAASRVQELVPIRYGRMLVSPFTFYRGAALDHGLGPVHHPPVRTQRPGLRRRPPEQLRRVRLGRAQPGLRPQRLRRDPARTLGVGREAAGRQPGHRRSRPGVLRQGASRRGPGGGRGLPDRDGQAGHHAGPRRLVRPHGHREGAGGDRGRSRAERSQECGQGRHKELSKVKARADKTAGQGQDPGQHAGAGEADPGGRRRDPLRQRPAPDGAHRGAAPRDGRAVP